MGAAKVVHLPGTQDDAPREPNAVIQDYLDHLCAPLVGIVPYERRLRLREEAEDNIMRRVDSYIHDGMDRMEAVYNAVEQYGDTRELSEQFLNEWFRYRPKGPVAKLIGLPMSYAAVFFTQATLWGLVLLQYRIFSPNPQPFTFGLSQAEIRHVIPEPLPLPEANPLWLAFWIYAFFVPIVAGWLTGVKALTGAAKATVTVLMPLIILSFITGMFMLPIQEGLWFALLQVIWWVPVGTLFAHVASVIARRRRLRFQPNWRLKS